MNKILIGGVDRSGTTYLASLLGMCQDVIVTPESLFKDDLPHDNIGSTHLSKLLVDWRFKIWGISITELRTSYDTKNDFLEHIVSIYAKKLGLKSIETWVDHSPNNIQKKHYNLLTNVTYVHITRNPYDVISSLIEREWGPNTSTFASIFWLKKQASCYSFHNTNVLVKFESLNDKSNIDNLYRKLDLIPINNKPVSYFLPDFTLKQHSLVGKKFTPKKKCSLNKYDLCVINFFLLDTITNLSYSPRRTNCSSYILLIYIFLHFIKEPLYRVLINPFRYKVIRENNYEQ
jgi:hypothetical protein